MVTLNYDFLLQEALIQNRIFGAALGAQANDFKEHPKGYIGIDIIYPHGACQFVLRMPAEFEKEQYSETMEIAGGGFYHFFFKGNIVNSYKKTKEFIRCMPLMCAYEPNKRAFGKNDFIDFQRKHYEVSTRLAKRIILIGVNCNYKNDRHIWEHIENSSAEIIFFEPSSNGIEKIKEWNSEAKIVQKTFNEGFEDICKLIGV